MTTRANRSRMSRLWCWNCSKHSEVKLCKCPTLQKFESVTLYSIEESWMIIYHNVILVSSYPPVLGSMCWCGPSVNRCSYCSQWQQMCYYWNLFFFSFFLFRSCFAQPIFANYTRRCLADTEKRLMYTRVRKKPCPKVCVRLPATLRCSLWCFLCLETISHLRAL